MSSTTKQDLNTPPRHLHSSNSTSTTNSINHCPPPPVTPPSPETPLLPHVSNSVASRYSSNPDSLGQHIQITNSDTGHQHQQQEDLLLTPTHSTPSPSSVSHSQSTTSIMVSSASFPSLSSLRQRNASANDVTQVSSKAAKEQVLAFKAELKTVRQHITLLHSPITTIIIFIQIVAEYVQSTLAYLLAHHTALYSLMTALGLISVLYILPGEHQPYVASIQYAVTFALWWVTLGVLSSVGLGTGLHTFVLYLGPFIAKTTLAVTECNTLDIAVHGEDAFLCPTHDLSIHSLAPVTFVGILYKIAPAAFLWGAGTAIGELPPYFVSRAATLSGQKLAELDEVEELDEQQHQAASASASVSTTPSSSSSLQSPSPAASPLHPSTSNHHPSHTHLSLVARIKVLIYHTLQQYGFWAIVLFASIPNPLFDLAGLACGHFLIPFWTFFGATCLGKAVIKAQLQSAVVILAFSKDRLTQIITAIENTIPYSTGRLLPFFERQRQQFHFDSHHVSKDSSGHVTSNTSSSAGDESVNYLSIAWNVFLVAMILYFVISIIDSTVQERLAMRDQLRIEKFAAERKIQLDRTEKDGS